LVAESAVVLPTIWKCMMTSVVLLYFGALAKICTFYWYPLEITFRNQGSGPVALTEREGRWRVS